MFSIDYLIMVESELCEQERGIDDYEYLYHKEIKEKLIELKQNQHKKHEYHGMSGTRIYKIWSSMKIRCSNPNLESFDNYGGRGIKVCPEWNNSFSNFYKWAINNGYADNLTLDRIDVNGNYEPSNCRWADIETQSYNKRNTIKVDIDGTVYTINELNKITGIDKKVLRKRIKNGKTNTDLLDKSAKKGYNKYLTYKDETKTYKEWEQELQLPSGTISHRLRSGWSAEEIVSLSKGKHRIKKEKRVLLDYNGKLYTLNDISDMTGLSYKIVQQRHKNGWTTQEIINTPKNKKH